MAIGLVGGCFILFLALCIFIQRVLNGLQKRGEVKNIKNHEIHSIEDPKYGTVYEDTIHLKIAGPKGNTAAVKWDDIEEVHAFKRDLFTFDLICLSFKKAGREEYYEISEDMVGYHDLLEILPRRLRSFNMEWFLSVASPAFETNHRIIWKK